MRRTGSNRLGDISVHYVSVMARTPWSSRASTAAAGCPVSGLAQPAHHARCAHQHSPLHAHGPCRHPADRRSRAGIGVRSARTPALRDLGIPGIAGACAPTLGESLGTLIAFERLTSYNSRGQSSTDRGTGGSMIASFYSISPYNSYNCFVVDAILSGWVQFLRHLSPDPVAPVAVDIEYAAPVDPQPTRSGWLSRQLRGAGKPH